MLLDESISKNVKKVKTPITMELSNFGPIKYGKITVKPLTILIGPNNSGKSNAAMLIYSLIQAQNLPTNQNIGFRNARLFPGKLSLELQKYPEIKEFIKKVKPGSQQQIPNNISKKVINDVYDSIITDLLAQKILHAFNCDFKELQSFETTSTKVTVELNSKQFPFTISPNGVKLENYPDHDIKLVIKRTDINKYFIDSGSNKDEDEYHFEIGNPKLETKRAIKNYDNFLNALLAFILDVYSGNILLNLYNRVGNCYYLPAARSGILQGYKIITASILQVAPYVGTRKMELPSYSGVVYDFMTSIVDLPEKKGPLNRLAQEFENEIVHGGIIVKKKDKHLSDLLYRIQGHHIPLNRASSTVSELAPLILYLRYYVKPGDTLIIEEPEAHLHPANQLILARLLVKLIRKDVNVVITTHSAFLLDQLSNLIVANKIQSEDILKNLGIDKNELLKVTDIAVYSFRRDQQDEGTTIYPISVDDDEGIPEDEFMKVYDALYDQSINVREQIIKYRLSG